MNLLRRLFAIKEMGVLLILAGLVAVMSVITDSFATQSNFTSIIQAIAPIAIMAIGQTFVILTAGIDLSVGSVCALSAYMMSVVLTHQAGYPLWLGVFTSIGTGAACGLISGVIITKLRVTPFIVTLGMLSACSGLTLGLSGGKQVGLGKFGEAVETKTSIIQAQGEIPGRPEVERKFYGEGAEVESISLALDGSSIWLGASRPGKVHLLSASYEQVLGTGLELERVLAVLPVGDGGVLAAGGPGRTVYHVSRDGMVSAFAEIEAEQITALAGSAAGGVWVASQAPARLFHFSNTGQALTENTLPEVGSVTGIAVDRDESIVISTASPGGLQRISDASETIYASTGEQAALPRFSPDGSLWFVEGGAKPNRLMRWETPGEGSPDLVWTTPKPPIRDYLVFPDEVAVVSTGNVGAVYIIRPDEEPVFLHPMTTHKGRRLALAGEDGPLLVGTSGPAGVSTLAITSRQTVYPVAEQFNNLFVYAPWTMAALIILAWMFLRSTTWGRYLFAIGGNETAARLSGIPVDRVKIFAYTLTGALAALAGIFLTSKLHTLDPNLAKGYELKVIAAVVIGGTSLMGGQGSVIGTLIGAALLFVLNYALVHLGMEDIWSDLFIGVIIILAAVIDSTRARLPEILASLGVRVTRQ